MQALKLKGRIDSNHRITLQLPEDTPVGDAEVIVLVPESATEAAREHLRKVFDEIDRSRHPRMSKEEIDNYIAEERASWD
jgi:hypothetical protein